MVLLNSLQEQRRVKAKLKHLLQTGHIVVKEREPAYSTLHAFRRVLVSRLCAQVIDLHHIAVIFLKETNDIPSSIAVKRLSTLGRETARDDPIRDVRHIQIKVVNLEPSLVC
jgi:hypothetical protein